MSGRPTPAEHTPPGGGGSGDQRFGVRPCLCSPARGGAWWGVHRRGLCFLEKRGCLPSPDSPPGAAPLLAAAPPKLGEPFFCQHSVNTQYCIKAINRHFKETETQFSHQSQEQRLGGGCGNVTTQLAVPLPPPTPPPAPPQVEEDTEQWAVPGCAALPIS